MSTSSESRCPLCEEEFTNKRERFIHLERWGCPIANKVLKELSAPKCACGCGERVVSSKRKPKVFNKYIHGHNKPKEKND